jgi:hypothetical protein
MVYIYTLNKNYFRFLPDKFKKELSCVINFHDEKGRCWLELDGRGVLIRKGYATDGCTPKINLFGWIVGTPDGPIQKDGYPQTYWASLVHDVLTQFQHDKKMIYNRKEMDDIFYYMLKECNWPYAKLYYYAVRIYSKITFQDR